MPYNAKDYAAPGSKLRTDLQDTEIVQAAALPDSGTPIVQTLYSLKVTLTHAEILALSSGTNKVLVPAPGPNKALVFQSATFRRPVWAAPYTITEFDSMKICYNGGSGGVAQDFYYDTEGSATQLYQLLSQFTTTDQVYLMYPQIQSNVSYGSVPNSISVLFINNKSIDLRYDAVDQPISSGNSANTLEVTVFYLVVDL